MAIKATGNGTKLPSVQSGISGSRKGVLVTVFRTYPDGNEGVLLRIWEQTGNQGVVAVKLPKGIRAKFVTQLNLIWEVIEEKMAIKNYLIRTMLKPFEPVSYILN